MALTPFVISIGPPLANRLASSKRVNRWLKTGRGAANEPTVNHLHDHVIIAGYGFNGRNLAAVLRDLDIPYVMLEMNPETVRSQRAVGESILYGDCTRPPMLHHASIEHARVYVLAISDPVSTRRSIHLARKMNPNVRVIVRTHHQSEIDDLRQLGADSVVPEEFETSLAVFGCVLIELHVAPTVIRRLTEKIRSEGYEAFREPSFGRVPVEMPQDLRAAIETDAIAVMPNTSATRRTLGELELRKRTGASVVAVRRGPTVLTNPGPDFRFEPGDVAVLLGHADQTAAASKQLHQEE